VATTNDIDTKAAVRKFLESRTVVDKEDKTADSADEIQTVLESVALSFLLYPQAALSFVLRAKNVLQQVVNTDLEILEYILSAIDDLDNPDEPITDTSDLIEAQTALVEIDRLGRVASDVRAYDRYTQAIDRFLDKKLAKSLKRRRRGELERTGFEAKQDLFRVLSVFAPTHGLMISRLGILLDAISDFESVPLTRIVSTKTLTRVRSSLNKVIQSINKDQLSKTAAAIELLAGAAALSSISNTRQVYDPTVDTGTHPTGRSISVRSEVVAAVATGTAAETSLSGVSTPWTFGITVNPEISGGTSFSVILPVTGASGRSYVKAATGSPTYNISSGNRTLYVQFNGITPPANEPVMVRTVTLPTGGAVSTSAILSALNNGSTGLIDGIAVELAPGTGRILIYGTSPVTKIVIRSQVPGTFDGSGNYIPAPGSVHTILGFTDDQTSGDPTVFTPSELVDLVASRVPGTVFSVVDGAPRIASTSIELLSSLSFSGVASRFGFSGKYLAEPSYLELVENGDALSPNSLGIFVGSVVSVFDVAALSSKNLFAPIDSIEGTRLKFATGIKLPRCVASVNTVVRVLSPLVYAVQTLFLNISTFRAVFNNDARNLQRVLSPLLSKPTVAQVADAKRAIQAIKDTVNDLLAHLADTVVRSDRSEFETVALQIMSALEERGLDRSLELLQACQFSSFFSLTKEEAAKGSRFLKASEQVGRNELATSTAEQSTDDSTPKGTTSDQNLLPGEELLEDEEQQ
jgi:hypothetical protein